MTMSMGSVIRQARDIRELSGVDAARAAGISPAYLSKLELDAVKRPSPHVLHQLSVALGLPYSQLMRLSGYQVPGDAAAGTERAVSSALFADLTDDEREELIEYLAWYRSRRRGARGAGSSERPD